MTELLLNPGYEGKEVVDSLGRKLVLKKPTKLDRYYLARAMGDDAQNQTLMSMMSTVLFIKSIDGEEIFRPINNNECLALLKRIGDEGDVAIIGAIDEYIQNEKEDVEEIKK